jgi:hypothetical protein
MADIFSHHEADLTTGVLAASSDMANDMWGQNALQTVTIARHYPRDPQQAIGYRGIVDYTSAVQTTDFTLDCILTEQSDAAAAGTSGSGTSIYRYADDQILLGTEHYVLTSCTVNFSAGAPATVSYGYITAGAGSALAELGSPPDVLVDGEEAYFAVVMGDDGSGIEFSDGAGTVPTFPNVVMPSGVQSVNFAATINKDNILDVRAAQPIQFITTYPIDVTCDVETYDPDASGPTSAGALTSLGVRLASGTNHADRSGYTAPSRTPGADFSALDKILVLCNGMIKVDETESLNVGGYVTYTYNYTASDLAIPLAHS